MPNFTFVAYLLSLAPATCYVHPYRPVWKKISKEAKDLIQRMLIVDPAVRLSASECLMHPWITGVAHSDEHLAHLEDAQLNMKSRMDKKKAAAK